VLHEISKILLQHFLNHTAEWQWGNCSSHDGNHIFSIVSHF